MELGLERGYTLGVDVVPCTNVELTAIINALYTFTFTFTILPCLGREEYQDSSKLQTPSTQHAERMRQHNV
jgi:hypothetical protein